MIKNLFSAAMLTSLIALGGCAATESSTQLAVQTVDVANKPYTGPKSKLVIGKFNNRSSFQNGIFSSGDDKLGGQAKSILMTHLQQSNRFILMDRANLEEIAAEAGFSGENQALIGANYLVTGSVAEFGRKEQGDKQLFGLLGKGKAQIAYAKVNLNIVDVKTSAVVYSAQGAGEYSLTNREFVGFGGTTSYDSTLNGKVLDLAIREAVNRLVEGIEVGAWKF